MKRKTIFWLCDVRDWAQHLQAQAIAKNLVDYRHTFSFKDDAYEPFCLKLVNADIVVCFNSYTMMLVATWVPKEKIIVRFAGSDIMPCNMRPRVAWTSDCAGWAYDALFKEYSALLPQFEHVPIYLGQGNTLMNTYNLSNADLVVAMHPLHLKEFAVKNHPCKVALLDGHRAFGG